MAPKKNKSTSGESNRVSISREEHETLLSLYDSIALAKGDSERAKLRFQDLSITCEAQARRLLELDSSARHLERIAGLQKVLIDLLRSEHKIASMEDLSEFWHRWVVCAENLVKANPDLRATIAQAQPELFRSWSLWLKEDGRAVHLPAAGDTRTEAEARVPASQDQVQDRAVDQLRSTNASQAARIRELEGEIEVYKKSKGLR